MSEINSGPEKALLDLIYLQPGADSPLYLHELRLQNLDGLHLDVLLRQAVDLQSPKLLRAVETISSLARSESEAYDEL